VLVIITLANDHRR